MASTESDISVRGSMGKPIVIGWADGLDWRKEKKVNRETVKRSMRTLFREAKKYGATHMVETTNGGVSVRVLYTTREKSERWAWLWVTGDSRKYKWPEERFGGVAIRWNPKVRRVRMVPVWENL